MDIRHLEYFVEAARHRSFTKAAQALHISQPSISKMIKSIEDELGIPLFARTSKQLELTDAGRAVLAQAQQIVGSFQNLTSELADVMAVKKGSLRIGLPPTAGPVFFPPIMGDFHRLYPHIQLKLTEVGSKLVEAAVEEGSLDVGVTCSPPYKSSAFGHVSIVREPLLLVTRPGHPLASLAEAPFSALADEPFVLYPEDFSLHDRITERCAEHGFQPNAVCETSQWSFMTELVAAGLGVALIPEAVCRSLDSARLSVVPLAGQPIYWHLNLIWKRDAYLSFAAREWLRFTTERFGAKAPI